MFIVFADRITEIDVEIHVNIDLDLSIDFFSYLFCIFQTVLLPNIMFYPIITTLDAGRRAGQE